METTTVYWGYIGEMESTMEATMSVRTFSYTKRKSLDFREQFG